jgi:alpha,alpha-trehalose phosphorylase
VIQHPAFPVEAWALRETGLHLDILARTESLFALANGHIGLRGNLDEGEPYGLPGTYINSLYEARPLPYAETAFGYPEAGQTIVNVTNGKLMRLLVDDEPFDVRYGDLRRHERVLDFRAGVLYREAEWQSPAGQAICVRSTRLVSFSQRSVAAILYEVEAIDAPARVVVQSELVANEPVPRVERDPRAAAAFDAPLVGQFHYEREARVVLVHATRASQLMMAAAMDHLVEGPARTETATEAGEDVGRFTIASALEPGERLRIVKLLAYGYSSRRSLPAVRDQVDAALAQARLSGFGALVDDQRAYLDDFWERADVEIDGDPELQQAARFALFHILQAGARCERRAIAAKGLTGPGYDGHSFWDAESYVLPVLTYTVPHAARDALAWRHSTLDLAKQRAEQLGLAGAAFPWRTIRGHECSAYWPAGTAAFHIGADIAAAVSRYQAVSGDEEFERAVGVELLVETARLWRSLGHHDSAGRFRIDGVTGPDEYSAIADNNVYTNLMAQQNLRDAAEMAERHPRLVARFGVDTEEAAAWRDAAEAMLIPFDEALGVHQQAEGFTEHAVWDFAATPPEHYPLFLHYPYFDIYRKQVVKQADLVLALHSRGDAFTDAEKARAFEYYEALTVRDSSLSACTQAIIAAEVGHLELAYDYFAEAALMDLGDRAHNTRDGLHMASLAGAWLVTVAGFGGLRDHGGMLRFRPRLPPALQRVSFRLAFRGRRLLVEVEASQARYTLREGEPLEIEHDGEPLTLTTEGPVTADVTLPPPRERPSQPAGREPARRVLAIRST